MPARALAELARHAAGGDGLEVAIAGEPGAVRAGRRLALGPAHRRPVPELPAAAAGRFKHEIALSKDELLDVVRRTSLMAQRNAPVRLSFDDGQPDPGGPDAGRRRGPRVAAGRVPRRARSRSGSTRTSCATASRACEGDTVRLKLISPLRPGAAPGRGRRLLVPDHADPAAVLTRRRARAGGGRAGHRLPLLRAAGRWTLRARPGRRGRPERRRQDGADRDGALRLPGLLAAHDQRRRSWCGSASEVLRVEAGRASRGPAVAVSRSATAPASPSG